MKQIQRYDAVFHYIQNLGAKAVAESGIPSDIYYFGKLLLTSLRTNPEWILQIDAKTGEQESSKSVLSRSIRCARSMSRRGLGKGDVIIISAPHHLDQCIPLYAAGYLGIAVYPIDVSIKGEEMKWAYENIKPKLIFCQNDIVVKVEDALNDAKIKADIVTFNDDKGHISFKQFLEETNDGTIEDDFQAVNLDPEEAIVVILSTGGTTGKPKATPLTHRRIALTFSYNWIHENEFPNSAKVFVGSSLQWISGVFLYYSSALYGFTRVQSSFPFSIEHWVDSIRHYKVNYLIVAPWVMTMLLNEAKRTNSTIPSLKNIMIVGNVVTEELLKSICDIAPDCVPIGSYGMSETGGPIVSACTYPPNSIGKILGIYQHRLVDPMTGVDITEPFKAGELLLKGVPGTGAIFKGYYNNPEGTAATFTEDGWFKTGDVLYKDENDFLYVEGRIKTLLQLITGKTSPAEIEGTILSHPGVSQAVVVGLRQDNLLDLPVACVVRKPGANVTAQELKDLVKSKLSDSKHLTGGVVFLDQFPLTVSCKVDMKKVQDIVQQSQRE